MDIGNKCGSMKVPVIMFTSRPLGVSSAQGLHSAAAEEEAAARRSYALLDDWRGKMAAPEEPELSQAQTEKLLQFQVDSLNSTLTHVCFKPHVLSGFLIWNHRNQWESVRLKPLFALSTWKHSLLRSPSS